MRPFARGFQRLSCACGRRDTPEILTNNLRAGGRVEKYRSAAAAAWLCGAGGDGALLYGHADTLALRGLEDVENLVERGALGGNEAGLAYEGLDLVHGGAVVEAGGQHDVLVEQRAAEVVAAEVQGHLAGFLAFGEPRGLNVLKVVQEDAGGRDDAQVAIGPRLLLDLLGQR